MLDDQICQSLERAKLQRQRWLDGEGIEIDEDGHEVEQVDDGE